VPTPRRAQPDGRHAPLLELAKKKQRAVAGKDFKTGQTFMKTSAGAGRSRRGCWGSMAGTSTNIWAIAHAEVLDDPILQEQGGLQLGRARSTSCSPHLYLRNMYGKMYHSVHINYYPRAETTRRAGTDIDIFGWMGLPHADSRSTSCAAIPILARAGVVLDLALFMDLAPAFGHARHSGMAVRSTGEPDDRRELYPEHDTFISILMKLRTPCATCAARN